MANGGDRKGAGLVAWEARGSEADVEIAQACGENEASCVREVMSARARAPRDVMYTHHRLL